MVVAVIMSMHAWAQRGSVDGRVEGAGKITSLITQNAGNPNSFPLAVWYQSPAHIAEFKGIGINVFLDPEGAANDDSLAAFDKASMPLIAEQNAAALRSPHRSIIIGWLQPDEPDNAQPDGHGSWGPCVAPDRVIASYKTLKSVDPGRPVYLNFGRGVSDTGWTGRGPCTGKTTNYYPQAIKGGDIVGFDVYPVADYGGRLELIAKGLDNLKTWVALSGTSRAIWNAVEAVQIGHGPVPTAYQIRAEVWMSIIHGSRGIVYFVHQFNPDGRLLREDGIFNFPEVVNAVKAVNAEVLSLAPILNSDAPFNHVSVSGPGAESVNTMTKQYENASYIFAVCISSACGATTFALPGYEHGLADVIGEGRALNITGGAFQDNFAGYGVHLYHVTKGHGQT